MIGYGVAIQPVAIEHSKGKIDQKSAGQGTVAFSPVYIVYLVANEKRSRTEINRQ